MGNSLSWLAVKGKSPETVLVQTFTGYKHDEPSPALETRGFEMLDSTRKSFLQRLFFK